MTPSPLTRKRPFTTPVHQTLKDALVLPMTQADRHAVRIVERGRPASLRDFDQIPMYGDDLLCQIKLVTPYLANKSVVFVGDADCSSLLIGLLSRLGNPTPAQMLVVDFDERLLMNMQQIARRYGFAHRLRTVLYNVFDPVPNDLVGKYDVFYTNPPYGSRNDGASARLFITRGCELTRSDAKGCIILPDDPQRPWSHHAMATTQQFLCNHGWSITEKLNDLHRYHLDDDAHLTSATMIVSQLSQMSETMIPMPYAGRRVDADEIPYFYGRDVTPPYPRYIRRDASRDHQWS